MRIRLIVGCLLLLAACGRKQAVPPPPEVQALPVTQPWTWHPLGGLAVIEGEVAVGTDLVLRGRSVEEHRYAEQGPVRWEIFRPPEGETAVLLDGAGQELAKFTFTLRPVVPPPPAKVRPVPAKPRVVPPAPKPVPPAKPVVAPAPRPQPPAARPPVLPAPKPPSAPPPKPPAVSKPQSVAPAKPVTVPAPKPQPAPPTPRARAKARMDARPVGSLAARRAPSVSSAPEQVPPVVARPYAAPVLKVPVPGPEPLPALPAGRLPLDWPGAGEGLNLTRGRGGRKQLLLSFDGGSNAEVATEVLDLLKTRGVRTTIFLTGAFIQQFPALVRRMAAEGHELGNHTMNHPHFAPGMKRDPRWNRERIQRELLDADAALVKLLGRPMDPVWRAPYGEHTADIRRWAEELGYRHIGWSEGADTLDWATPKERSLYRSGGAIVQRLEQRLNRDGDGLIVLMHLGSERVEGDRPTKTLGAFMDRALRAGWTFVPVSVFLRDLGKPAWDGQRRLALLAATRPKEVSALR